ncbi:MAG TPA: hypothetical protein PLI16_07130 [Bacteroidales bacterium]|nr:hypothetical protein [Bacteroidales bacterium]HOH84369.1 hypothetical protein [Bacteroidales bacterium]
MKKIAFFIFALGFAVSFSACKKDKGADPVSGCMDSGSLYYNPLATVDDGTCVVPEQVQKALVFQVTATDCVNCGMWGGDTLDALVANNPGKVVPIALHYGDNMTPNVLRFGFSPILPSTIGTPYFKIGDVETYYYNSQVAALCAQTPVVAQTAFIYTQGSETVNVKTRTEFFTDVDGVYMLAVYVLESGIDGTSGPYVQEGGSTGYQHNYVLRASSYNNSPFGETIVPSGALAGKTVDKTYDITFSKLSATSAINIATVIWKKEGSEYKFINGYYK